MKCKTFLRRLAATCCVLALLVTSAAALSVEDARALLEETYVDALPEAAYEADTLEELFAAIGDPYTYYMTAEEYSDFLSSVEHEDSITGIGAAINYTDEGILLTGVLVGGGAEEVGLQAGDLIIAIEGESCAPAGEAHRALLVGEAGTYVNVTVRHADGREEDYRIERRLVEIHNTSTALWDGGIAYIDCDSFGSDTGTYFAQGIQDYDDDAHIFVVDIRNNTGGVTSSAVYSTGTFTGPAALLYLRDKAGTYRQSANYYDALTEDPVIVLTNAYSASAAEIFAADIRDCGAGILLGGRTYGKGVAQVVYNWMTHPSLFDGDALKITAYRFYSADGNTNDLIGVFPTLLVNSNLAQDVAKLLAEEEPSRPEGYLRLGLNGWYFYVDLDKAQAEEYQAAFSDLLSALPPDVDIAIGAGSLWVETTAREVVETYGGEDFQSRWFSDVADSPYADAINTLATYGILNGDSSGSFNPTGELTRAQLCALMAQALGIGYTGESQFSDVSADRWYASAVNAMAELGFVEGYSDGTFQPDALLTYEQFITFMSRLAAYLNLDVYEYVKDQDTQALAEDAELAAFSSWAKSGVDVMARMMRSSADDSVVSMLPVALEDIDPQATVLREEAAATLNNLLQMLGIIDY